MAVMVWDERSYKFYIRCRPNESYEPSDEVNSLVSEAEDISKEYHVLAERLTQMFSRCEKWNIANDKTYAINHKAQQDRKKASGKFIKKS